MHNDMFFCKMMENISIGNSHNFSKQNFLKETCEFFGISHAFIYEIDRNGIFNKTEHYESFNTPPLSDSLDIKTILGLELLSELSSSKIIMCSEETEATALYQRLNEMFTSKTLILIPILNQHYELAGFVGLSDRRSQTRKENVDLKTSCAVLSLLANYVKLELFQKGIANTEKVLSNVLDNTGVDIYVNDYYTHDVLYVNKSMALPYGGVDNMIGKKCWQTIFTDKLGPCEFCPQPKLLDEDGNLNKTYTWDYERKLDGSWFRVFSSSMPWTDGRIAHLVVSVDITENKRNQLLIEKLAQFDHLTGLPNRRSLNDDIGAFIKDDTLFSEEWYVLFCDLDGFKAINDTIGHTGGDALLIAISKKLQELPHEYARAYRQGGDEFVILLKDKHSVEYMKKTLDDLLGIFCDNYSYGDFDMRCGCSIGISHFPTTAKTHKELSHKADTAMYSAKKAGKGTIRFYLDDSCVSFEEYFHNK